MASFLIKGQCLSNAAEQLTAAQSMFPMVASTGTGTITTAPTYVSLTASSFNNLTGVFTFSTKNQAGTAQTTNGTMQMPACTAAGFQDYSTSIIIFYAALFIAFCMGFNTTYRA